MEGRSHHIVHHKCHLSKLGRSPLLLYRRAHRLVLGIVSRRIGRRRTLLNIESNSKWFLICQPHSRHLFAGRQGWLDVTISRSLSRQCFCIDRRSTPSNAITYRFALGCWCHFARCTSPARPSTPFIPFCCILIAVRRCHRITKPPHRTVY